MSLNLFRGYPSNHLLPSETIADAFRAVLCNPRGGDTDDNVRHPLAYGSDPGSLSVRTAISTWSQRRFTSCNTEAAHINLTNGASYGAAIALSQCCPREYTTAAFAVSPLYFLMTPVLNDAGFTTRTYAVREDPVKGLDLDEFESRLSKFDAEAPEVVSGEKKNGIYRYVLYVVPTFSNPGGYTLTCDERQRLLNIARKHNVLLLCDEVYNLLDFRADKEKQQEKLLVQLDRDTLPEGSWGHVIANFSMSKYLGPGLRVGWQETATPQLAHHLSQNGAVRSGGTPAQLNTFIVQHMLETGTVDAIIDNLNAVYGKRSSLYRAALETHMPQGTKITGGEGGYFFWLTLPDGYDVPAITAECKAKNLILAPGDRFEVPNEVYGWGKHCYRVSLSYYEFEDTKPFIELWGAVCRNHYQPSS